MKQEDIEKVAFEFCQGEPHLTTHLTRIIVQQVNEALEEAANALLDEEIIDMRYEDQIRALKIP